MKRDCLSGIAIAKAVIPVGIASLGLTQKRSPNLLPKAPVKKGAIDVPPLKRVRSSVVGCFSAGEGREGGADWEVFSPPTPPTPSTPPTDFDHTPLKRGIEVLGFQCVSSVRLTLAP
jgi:hypothetical protein